MQLHYVAQAKPDEPAVIHVKDGGTEERISWSELDRLTSRMAWMLMTLDRVLSWAEKYGIMHVSQRN